MNVYLKSKAVLKPVTVFLFSITFAFQANAQGNTFMLQSGEPVKNSTPGGVGRLALPFYNGYLAGFVAISGKEKTDLFLQGTDGHGRGLYFYTFRKLSAAGVPVYSHPRKITMPFTDKGNNRTVMLQAGDGKIYGIWSFGKTLKWAQFNPSTYTFSGLKTIKIAGLPRGYSDYGIVQLKNGKYLLLFSVREEGIFSNGKPFPAKIMYTPEGFWPYEIARAGIYGAMIDELNTSQVAVKQFTKLNQAYYSLEGFALYRQGAQSFLLSGSRLGNILMYNLNENDGTVGERKYAADSENILLRNPNVHACTGYFYYSPGNQGLVTVGEGGIYYYPNTEKFSKTGNLIFKEPQPLLQEQPDLYGGSLVVPAIADWDGDGKLDMISGNSMGFIFFYKNTGTNANPQYIEPVPLKAGDKIIHVQPGYREDIQGPGEARWGYTCPTVIDWNGDGLPDILTGDSRGKFMVYLNKGTKTQPVLEPEHPLYINGMDMYGTWRVKPGVAKVGNRMAYVIMDRDDEFHLYWQLDKYNLEDGGKLKLTTNQTIHGNYYGGGTVGRAKIELVDWDEDGKMDLLVGTYGKQSIPDTITGLPLHMKPKRASTVLFLKNVGTDEQPVYEYPKVLKFKGNNLSLGGHSCAPATARIGPGNRLNLIVGIETGAYMFYDRKDLSW